MCDVFIIHFHYWSALNSNILQFLCCYILLFIRQIISWLPQSTNIFYPFLGTFAVITLLVGRSVVEYSKNPAFTHTVSQEINGTLIYKDVMYTELEVGTTVTLIVSFFHVK